MKKVTIYTDGSCQGNPGPGGWAAILRYGTEERVLSGGSLETTNNRMELNAALQALKALKERCDVKLHTDSQYLKRAFTDGWIDKWRSNGWMTTNRQPVKNQDLWQALWNETQKHSVQWIKVKAHANNKLNNRVDQLAVSAGERVSRVSEHT
ncbi:MAG: ribonuclease HI [Rhodothermaceae bacterium]|nr:ribonuclease HI [Rhodothermaceae bacterium]MXZ18865.1 ribonuclease HI [Rhodothermaceae bacterium]MXZ58226.1 ribonuclease HI [Rhodothermaceae bacterium]MYB92020.1 ribonuclease HI [Rhodothermaceae bacterium]MYD66756.1 ribonuclease HI [Rhodothermaceae bacterium]